MTSLRPLKNNVLLIPYKQKETKNGIIIPDCVLEKEVPPAYIVSAVGPEVVEKDLKEGTVVLIPRQTGLWVPFEDFKYILVKETDILAIMEGATYERIPEKEGNENE